MAVFFCSKQLAVNSENKFETLLLKEEDAMSGFGSSDLVFEDSIISVSLIQAIYI